MNETALDGGCSCGSTRYRVTGAPLWVAFCHCKSCRRATGAPVSAYAGYDQKQLLWSGQRPGSYSSSSGVRRRFCSTCGSPLSYESTRWPGEIHIHLGSLDQPERLEPSGHAFASERVPWLRIDRLD